jgi:hypothetical protein
MRHILEVHKDKIVFARFFAISVIEFPEGKATPCSPNLALEIPAAVASLAQPRQSDPKTVLGIGHKNAPQTGCPSNVAPGYFAEIETQNLRWKSVLQAQLSHKFFPRSIDVKWPTEECASVRVVPNGHAILRPQVRWPFLVSTTARIEFQAFVLHPFRRMSIAHL